MISNRHAGGFVEANGFGFTSQLIGVDDGGLILPGLEAQMQAALSELDMLLEEDGLENRSVVKVTLYIANEDDYEEVDKIYYEFFSETLPARTTLLTQLPKKPSQGPNDILFAIEAVVSMNQYEDQGQ